MPRPRTGVRPVVEGLDQRLVLSVSQPAAVAAHRAAVVAPARTFTPDDLQAYADAYLSSRGGARFDAKYDFNHDGRITKGDVGPILRGLARSTPRGPFVLTLSLAPGEQARLPHPANSGAVTRKADVTVVGHTTPNSIIFTDGPTVTLPGVQTTGYRFLGTPVVSDARGRFSYPVTLEPLSTGGSLTNTAYLVRTPFGHQVIRAFPIRRLP